MQGSKPSEGVVYKRLEGPICAQNVRRDRLDLGRLDIPNGKFWYNFDQFRIQAAHISIFRSISGPGHVHARFEQFRMSDPGLHPVRMILHS